MALDFRYAPKDMIEDYFRGKSVKNANLEKLEMDGEEIAKIQYAIFDEITKEKKQIRTELVSIQSIEDLISKSEEEIALFKKFLKEVKDVN